MQTDDRRSSLLVRRGLVPVWSLVLALLRVATDTETDALWTAREGLDLLAGSALIHPDRWSYAPQAHDFVPNSPGWQWLLGLAWSAFGRWGLIGLAVAAYVLCLLSLAMISRRLGASELSIAVGLVVVVSLDGALFVNRAALPAFIWFLVGIDVLWRANPATCKSRPTKTVVALTGGTAIWVLAGLWLHNSWSLWMIVSVSCVGIWANAAGARARGQVVACLGGATVGAAVAVALGPLGARLMAQTYWVADQVSGANLEWVGSLDRGPRWVLLYFVALAAGSRLTFRAWRRRDAHLGGYRLVLALGLLLGTIAGAFAFRFLLLAMLCGMPLLAASATSRTRSRRESALRLQLGERASAPYWERILLAAGVVASPVAMLMALQLSYPALADPAVSAIPTQCRLFADDASAVLLERPDVQLWWDDRQDYWGRARWSEGLRYLAATTPTLVPPGTTCVLLHQMSPVNQWPPLRARLDVDPRWRVAASSEAWRVWQQVS